MVATWRHPLLSPPFPTRVLNVPIDERVDERVVVPIGKPRKNIGPLDELWCLSNQCRLQYLSRYGHFEFGRPLNTKYMGLVMRSYISNAQDASSPLFASLHSNPKGVPTTLVFSAGFDTLRDEGEQYAEMLKASGISAQWVRYGDAPHGFTQMFQQVGVGMAGRLSLDEGATALKAAFGRMLVP